MAKPITTPNSGSLAVSPALMPLTEIYEHLLTIESMVVVAADNLDHREDETVHVARQLHEVREMLKRVYEAVDLHRDAARGKSA